MKVLIVVPHYGEKDFYYMPLGMTYVSAYLKSKGYDVFFLNLNHHPFSRLREVLQEVRFDAVTTGGLFIHMRPLRAIVETAKIYNPGAKIILGGAVATGDPKFILEELKPDFLTIGEAEWTIDQLLQAIGNKSDFNQVKGIAFMENGNFVRTTPQELIEPLDSLPYPDYEGFEFSHYLDHFAENVQHLAPVRGNIKNRRVGMVISSRDCASKCTFCFRIMGGTYRVRSVENVMGELRYLVENHRINEVYLMDDMFAAKKDRIREFCKELKQLGLPWQCQVRVTSVDDEMLGLMKDAGCYLISFGFESGSKEVLRSMKKGTTPVLIERAIELSLKHKITAQGNFIFGDPAETIETMNDTIDFTRKFKKLCVGYGTVIPYPGTSLYFNLIERGKLTDRLRFHEDSRCQLFNMTNMPELDFKYLVRRVTTENHLRMVWRSGKLRNVKKIDKNAWSMDIRCHHCNGWNENCKLDFRFGELVVCKHCYQRTFADITDIRFMNLQVICRRYFYRYIMSWIVATPQRFRKLYPLVLWFGSVKRSMIQLDKDIKGLKMRMKYALQVLTKNAPMPQPETAAASSSLAAGPAAVINEKGYAQRIEVDSKKKEKLRAGYFDEAYQGIVEKI